MATSVAIPENTVPVKVRVAVDGIASVDQASQSFGADLWVIWLKQRVILTTRKAWFPNDDKREQVKIFFESFAPKEKEAGRASGPGRWVASQNMVEVEVDNPSHPRVGFEETGDEFCLSWRLVGRFAESWELQNFPFDCQDFTVSMMIRYPAKRGDLRMMPVDSQQSQIRQKAFPVLQNTWYHPKQSRLHVWEEKVPRVEPKPNAERVIMRPTVNVTVSMRRIPNYYLMNVVMPMFFIVCMGFGSLLVPHDQVWDRFSASFTVVLTAVAYKFVVAQMVPPIGYSTWLDEYMTLCFLILMAVVLENCLAVRVRSIHENELVAGCIIFVLFVLLNLRFAQKACSARRRHSRITEQLRRCDPEQIRIGAESFQKLPCMEDDPLPSAVDVTHHFVSQTDSSEGSASS